MPTNENTSVQITKQTRKRIEDNIQKIAEKQVIKGFITVDQYINYLMDKEGDDE